LYLACEGREIHVTEWGQAGAPVLVAWHGLARTGRDMDAVAAHLAPRWRVICPDTLGRGLSQWSPLPGQEYCLAFYEKLAVALVDQLGITRCTGWAPPWAAPSAEGGGRCAEGPHPAPGAQRHRPAAGRAGRAAHPQLCRQPAGICHHGELEAYFRTVYKPYGWLSEAQWRQLAETSMRRLPDGRVTPHYDPAMVQQFEQHPHDYDQWDAWDTLTLPVLCLRGGAFRPAAARGGRSDARARAACRGGRPSPAAGMRRR
jgi:hypothetical protein